MQVRFFSSLSLQVSISLYHSSRTPELGGTNSSKGWRDSKRAEQWRALGDDFRTLSREVVPSVPGLAVHPI